ncbi:hypothetical protein VPH35_109502 [Triticum aestivum]|uniref:titin homolog isoform X2 n=1 Tax=Triticum aestivum TaxID=4565 RepID=UPI0008459769|nr:titin homolog isoform X2 [Triticum aestivum]
MATEDEAREAADGEEVQVEAGDLGTTHLQMNLDSKLSSHAEMKDEARAMDSTEGMKVSEDQVLERAPSVVEIPQEDAPNGTHASLNGHMKEGKISNEKPQENGQKGNEQVEALPDGISTDRSSTSNGEEAIDSLDHVENTTEGTSLLKHDNEEPKEHCQRDVEGAAIESKMVHKDTLQPDNDVEPTIDAQQGHNLEPAEVTEDTQPTTMPCIPGEEVVAEAPAGVQTSLEPNVDEPDALPDNSDGNTETVEPAKVDKENCPEDEDIETVKPEDQPSDKTDDVEADVVHEEVPKSKKTDVPEDMPKTGQADESMNGDQEVLNQESTEETSDPLPEKTEETSHESNVSTSEETTPEHDAVTREPALDVQEVQNQGLAEEIADAKEVDTEQKVQQSGIAFEEATPEDNATIIEPSSDIQHLNNVESEEIKGLEDAKAEESSDQSNVTIAEDATQDKEATKDMQPVQGLEEEEPKNTGTVVMDEASSQPHADVTNNLAEEDSVPACQPQVTELKEEVKDTGATETQEITQQSHAAASEELIAEDNSMAIEPLIDEIQQPLEKASAEVKHAEVSETPEICHERTISAPEDSVKDDVTAEGPTSDAQEVENVASVEEIKDNTAENIIETSSVATTEEADQEKNVLTSEDVTEQQMRGLETEEIQNTEPVEKEEVSDQRHPSLLNDSAQEDSIPSDGPKTESTVGVKETEALPQESNVTISEEPASEENITASEVTCDDQEVKKLEQAKGVESNKDTKTKEISDQSTEVFARETTQGTSDIAREPAVDMQSVQELESEKKNAELTEVSEASGQLDAAVIENPTHEDNLTTSESLVMEPAEVSSNEATEGQEMPQSDATQSEDHKTEGNVAVSEPQILEPEPAEEMRDSEATEPRAIPQESMSVPEEDVTAKEAASDIKEVQTEEIVGEPDDVRAEEISNQSSGTIVGETAQDKLLSSDPTSDVQAKELESQKIGNSEDVQTEEGSHQTHAEENLTENEPQIATEDNTAILTDVHIQQLQEQEPVEFRDTEATEPQGISPSHTASGSEQSTPEDNEMTDPSPATQAENLESAILTEESKDVKSTDAIAEEETPRERIQESGAHVDIPPVENTEPVEVHDNVTTDDLPTEELKDNEAIEVAEIHYESPVANIGDLTEDAKSNVALEDEAAPGEDVKTEATGIQPQETELEEIKNSEPVEVEDNIIARDLPAEEIKDTEAMETEMIPHESTGAKISELINDVKSNVALADEAAPDEYSKATEATHATPQPQEPDLEDIKNSEPAEVERNTSASDLPAEKVKDTEAVETEAINESTDANNSEFTEDLQSNVALTDEATHDEHVAVAETTVDIPQAQEPELEEVKNIEPVEVEETRSASDLPAEDVKETEAINGSTIANTSKLSEDVTSNVVPADEAAPEEHVIATEATVDIPEAQEPELEETKSTEPAEVEENISANDLPAEEVKDTEAVETEAINESTDSNNSELPEDLKNNVALADVAAPEEHVTVADDTFDMPQAQEPEVEEMKNTEPVEVEENISASDLPAEEVKDTEEINESADANISELTEEVKCNVALADEEPHEEHVTVAETAVDIPQPQELELEEIKNTEPVEVEENMSASDMQAEEVKPTEAINESTDANISELTEDVKTDVALADEAAPEEHVIATEATVDIPQAQDPELEEIKNTETVEVEENISASDLPAEEVKDAEAKETEAITESTDANISELTEDVKSTVTRADEAAPEEHVTAAEAAVDIPQAQVSELQELENVEPDEVEENRSTGDLPAEEVKEIEAKETEAINESTDANISELTGNVTSNVTPADEAAPEEHVTATEATVDIPRAQEPDLEEIENVEPVEVEENASANDMLAEEVKDTEAKETDAINESSDANISELTEDMKSNVALIDEAAHEEHVTVAETTADIPQAQEPELEKIKNTEAGDLSAEEVKEIEPKETEAISERTDANISELNEDVKSNVALADEEPHAEQVTVTERTVDIPQAQEPELEEIENTEPVEVEENRSASDLQAEEVKETEAINERTVANTSELPEDVTSNVVPADEAAPEEHVIATEATVDIPEAQGPELEETKSTEPAEVEENISANYLPAEEVKDTEAIETEAINENTDANNTELTEDVKNNVALADEAAPEEHITVADDTVDMPQVQEPEVEEIKNTEPVEVEEKMSASDMQAEEVKDTEAINESTDANISELSEDVKTNVALADEAAPEEHVIATEATVNIPQAQELELEEIKNTEPVEVEENMSASDMQTEEVKNSEAINESTDENISELTEDVKTNVDEADPEEHVIATEATVDIPQAQDPELEEIKNTEPVEVEENISASDLPAEEVKDAEAKETEAITESTDANISELTEDVKSNVTRADEAAPEEHVVAAEAAVDIPQAQVSELQELENVEPDEVEENRSAGDLPAEEVKEIEAKETEAINESTDANISELTGDVTSNVTPADEAAPEEHVTATEATVDIPRAQEPELEEIKNVEPVEVEENASASDMPAEEVKDTEPKETEAISERTDANIRELNEDVKSNVALADEEPHAEQVTVAERTVDMPQAQEPELEEIKNTEPVEVEENRSASDMQAEEVKETEAINESPDANISELTEDVTSNVAPADEAAPEEHVIATKATVDIPRAQEPDPEAMKNTEPVEVEEFISASDLPTEEVKETETKETEAINESTDANISELTEDVKGNIAHADEAAPEEHVIAAEATDDIPQAQVPELKEFENTEPVEVEENKSATDLPAEEVKDIETIETEAVNKNADTNISELTEDVTLAEEAAADVQINVPPAKEPALEEMKNIEPVEAEDGITADNVPAEEINDTEAMETREIPHENTDDSLIASAELPDIQQAVEDKACTDTTENQGEPQRSIVSTSAELTPTEEETAVVEHTQDTHVQDASSGPGSDPNLLVQSAHQSELAEDSKGQFVKAEETGQSNGATLEEPTAEDNAANEISPLADSKQEHGVESMEQNKCIDATEGEEASHLSQDPGLEEPVSERDTTTVEPTSDIQQVNDMDEAEEMAATEPINGEEISSQKTDVATLEDPSPTDNETAPEQNPVELDEENLGNEISNAILADENIKEEVQEPTEQKDESSDLGEKTAFTTQKDESATEEDIVQISGEDTVGTSNNIEQIKELPKSVIEHNAITSGGHTNDQDDEQLHNVELQMQVCERSVDVLTTEKPDDHIQKVSLDQQQKQDEAIEKQTEEIQTDEQKHDDSRADFTTETILEPQSNEIDTTNRNDDADVFEAEQTEAVTTEMLKNEQTPHIAQESIPSVTDAKVENSTEIEETTEQEDAPNNTGTLYTDADAEKYNEDEKENTEIDAAVAKTSTDKQDGTTDETINEEDPTVVPQNVESRVHSEEKECINKANDGMQAIQASEEEIVDEVEKEEIQNEDTNVNHEEIETKLVDGEASGLQDLSFHPKVVDDKLATEQNGAEVETDSNEEMATGYTAVTESVKLGEAIYDKAGGADVALSDENLETIEDNRRNLEASPAVTASVESMKEDNEHHKPALPAHSAVDGNETEQASGLEVTERELFPEKPLPTESEEQEESQITTEQDGENVQEQETDDTEKEKEAEQSDLPVSHFLMNLIMGKESNEPDRNSEFKAEKKQEETTKDGSSLITSQQEESLVPIPTENKVDNEHIFEQGKHNLEGSEETHDIKLEKDEELNRNTHDLEAPVCQNNVQGETSSEMVPGGSGLTTEMETRDIKLGEKATNSVCQEHMEATTQIEEGSLKSNLHDITSPKVSQEDTLEEGRTDLQHEPLPEKRSSDAVSGQTLLLTEPNMGDEKNLPNDTDDLQSPLSTKREESNESSITEAESTVEAELENGVDKEEKNQQTTMTGGATEEQIENEHDISQKGTEAISDEQKGEITEPVMGNEINLVHEKGISADSECKDEKQSSKFSNSELDNSEKASEIQLDGSSLHIDQDKQDESAGDQIVMEKNNLLDKPGESDLQKVQETEVAQESPEESDEGDQNSLPIREPVIKEVNENKTVDSHVQTVDTQSQEEQETFNSQVQERDLDVASPEEAPEAEENIVESKPEFSRDEEQSPKKDESNMAGEKTYDEKTKGAQEAKSLTDEAKTKVEEQGVVQKASHNQKRDLDVVSPTEAPGSEENVVDIKEPEFSTDEEESPKKDVSNMAEEKSYDKKTNGDEEAKNFTDDAPTKIEEREAGQKASPKKHNILSGVGSKVKHQLAKVKKAIIGKPGHTKSESPKV